jgi:endonuclease/exonuclease/phosphatase (EEP) superfamily protein YafD
MIIGISALLLALYSNLKRILKFTALTAVQVKEHDEAHTKKYSLLTINVLQTNSCYTSLLNKIELHKPDIILILEADKHWADALSTIFQDYPHSVRKPQNNFYGIILLSKYPIVDAEIRHIVKNAIPSIDCTVNLNDHPIRFFGVHPEPPSPTEQETSTDRDAELMRLASEIKKIDSSIIVAGDLNDVVWSRVSELFTKESGLIDPRIGRGFFSTFSAKLPKIFRFPVDQLYHTNDIHHAQLRTITVKGSDHLGILYTFSLHPTMLDKNTTSDLDSKEKELLEASKNRTT